jgi:WD40 repeat protein
MDLYDDGNMILKEIQTLEGHTDRVWSLAWNPATATSPVFASCSGDKTVRIWEQTPSTRLCHCKVSSSSSFASQIKLEPILEYFGRVWLGSCVNLVDSCVGRILWLIMGWLQAVLEETHTRTVRSCAWSPSGKLLATASFDATTSIWENISGDFECVSTLEVFNLRKKIFFSSLIKFYHTWD